MAKKRKKIIRREKRSTMKIRTRTKRLRRRRQAGVRQMVKTTEDGRRGGKQD